MIMADLPASRVLRLSSRTLRVFLLEELEEELVDAKLATRTLEVVTLKAWLKLRADLFEFWWQKEASLGWE